MATSPNDKLFPISKDKLTKLCLYSIFGPENPKKLASLFNENYGGKLSPKQIKDAYEYMHDVEHPFFRDARDLNRTNRAQLVNILKDELFYPDDKLREQIIQPSRPMAGLRKPRRAKTKDKATGGDLENSMTDDNMMVESVSDKFEDSGAGKHRER